MLITNLAEIIERPYFKATFQFFCINLNTRTASSCCHEQHSPTHPGFYLINRKQPIQSQSRVTVDVPSLKKDPLSLWGSLFNADTNGPPTWKPSKDLCRQKCLRVFFCTVPSFAFLVEFLHFINTFFSWTHLSFPLRLQFQLAGLSLLSGQVGVVGEDIIVNMGKWLMSNYNLVQISHRLISLDELRL